MRAAGIIAEYNPFHNGHKYHLEKTREITGAEVIAVVLSSNFLQRGEPSLIGKWKRSENALENGADIVIELPTVYSNQSAEIFSFGAVSLLAAIKSEAFVFGSESGDIREIEEIVDTLINNKDEVDRLIKGELEKGLSYPNAVNNAFAVLTGKEGCFTPNNILGIEYIKNVRKIGSEMKPMTIKRHKAGYHSEEIYGDIASATAVRKHFLEGYIDEVKKTVPYSVYETLIEEKQNNRLGIINKFYQYIRFALISGQIDLQKIQDIESGFENRLIEAARAARDYETFFEMIKTRRYSNSRISRIITHILTGITNEITEDAKKGVPYIRVLGMNNSGREYLNKIKKETDIPIITNLRGIEKKLDDRALKFLRFENNCSDIYRTITDVKDLREPILKF